MSSKSAFGIELKKKVLMKENVEKIGDWAYGFYLDLPHTENADFLELLLNLGTMELGPEFAFTYEELDKIADDLIAGKDVIL